MTEHHRVAIIGAGFGGIATAIGLRRDGCDDFVVIDKASGVGGTWHHNRYPGAECDVKSHLYCFSFEPNPRWSRRYAAQPEILAYLEGVVERYGLVPHLRLSTAVQSMTWEEDRSRWRLVTESGEITADVVVSAVGMFNEPVWPTIEGLHDFEGPVVHTARWPDDERFEGKRVAVIGTAASSVQLVPELAESVEQLFVFQRTPVWVLPKEDGAYTDEEISAFLDDPEALAALRQQLTDLVNRTMTFDDEELIRAAAENGWRNIDAVTDPEIREKLTPTLPWGSRRPLLSNRYYPTFNRPNVELVTDRIEKVVPEGVVSADGTLREVDAVVCATGFAVTRYLSVIDVVGRDGRRLGDDWADEPRAYLGVLAAGYPNLVMLYGPNTNNGSIVSMLEYQAEFAVRQVRWMTDEGIAWFDVRPEVVEDFDQRLQTALDAVEVWKAQPDGYYRGPSGRIVTQWPHTMLDYEAGLRAIDESILETRRTAGAER